MSSYDAGDARLRVIPDVSQFKRKLEADMSKVRAEFAIDVTANTAQARADIERFRSIEQRNGIALGVDVDLGRARAEMDAFRIRQQANALNLRVDVDSSPLQNALSRLNQVGGGVSAGGGGGGGILSIAALGTLGVGSLPALASAAADVVAVVQQLAGAGLVLPGVIGGIASSAVTAKVGFTGMSDAIDAVNKAADGTPKSIQAADAALKKLAPAAADVVKTIVEVKPAWDKAVRDTFQQNMFDGIAPAAKQSFDELFPVIQDGLGKISTAWNGTFKGLLSAAGADSTKSFLERIFGNTADAQNIANGAIAPITNAIGALTAKGSESLPRIANDIKSVAERFDNWIAQTSADGRLDDWINHGITGLEHLGNTGVNIAGSISGIARAVDGDLLGSIERVTGKWDEWMNSVEGQAALKDLLKEGNEQLGHMSDTVSNLGPLFKQNFENAATLVGAVATAADATTTALGKIPGAIEAMSGPLGALLEAYRVITGPSALESAQQKAADALAAARARDPRTQIGPVAPGPAVSPNPANNVPVVGSPVAPPVGPVSPSPSGDWTQLPGIKIPTRARGGPTPSGRGTGPTGGFLAEVHSDEWVLPAHARAAIGDQALWTMTQGRSFEPGGYVDQWGNPVTPGPAAGPGGGPIAPNPTAGGGGLNSIIGSFVSSLGTVGNNVLSLGQGLMSAAPGAAGAPDPGAQTQHGVGTLAPVGGNGSMVPTFADRAAGVPGFVGLLGSMFSSNPDDSLMNWGEQTAAWLGNFTAKTAGAFGSALLDGGGKGGGILGFFGLQNSILSPSNPYNQAAQQAGGFFLDSSGPIGTLLGNRQSGSGSGGSGGSLDNLTPAQIQQLLAVQGQSGTSQSGIKLGTGAGAGVGKGGAERWRPVVLKALAEIGPKYGITNINGWADALIGQIQFESGGNPGALNPNDSDGLPAIGLGQFKSATFNAHNVTGGSINDGVAQIYAMIDYVATRYGQTASGVPKYINQGHGYSAGGKVWGAGTETSDSIPAWLSNNEHVLTASDVNAMGGQDNVYKFRNALHRSTGGDIKIAEIIGSGTQRGWIDNDMNGTQGQQRPRWSEKAGPGLQPGPDWNSKGGPSRRDSITFPWEPWIPLDPYRQNRRGVRALGNAVIPGFAPGGAVLGMIQPPPRPDFQVPNAQTKVVPPQPPVPSRPSTGPGTPPAPAPAPAQVDTNTPNYPPFTGAPGGITGIGSNAVAPPGTINHNLKAVDTLIDSTASTLGNLAATAASMGMGAAGAIAPGAGAASGLVSSMVAGGVQQIGKIAKKVVNIGSSALVGNVPGSFGNPDMDASGQTIRPQQNIPVTAPNRVQNNTFNGMDIPRVFQELDLRDAVASQAILANHPA